VRVPLLLCPAGCCQRGRCSPELLLLYLTFYPCPPEDCLLPHPSSALLFLSRYVQDYIGIYGLRMWQEEFSRVVAFNTEQEANKFARVRVLPDASVHQSRAIPIPLFTQVRTPICRCCCCCCYNSSPPGAPTYACPPAQAPPGDTSGATTFMGRLVDAFLTLSDPVSAVGVTARAPTRLPPPPPLPFLFS
jgi:hypothetical protein